ncbi:hypothetical protein D3C84_815590 [compost metagenome]
MAEHHPFGKTGGATGVENPQQCLATATHILHRWVVGDQRFVSEHSWRCLAHADMNDVLHGHRLFDNVFSLLAEGVINDQNRGFRVVQRIKNFAETPAVVDWIEHGVRPRHREEILKVAC